MTTYLIRIDPNGDVTPLPETARDLLAVAASELGATVDVVTLAHNGVTPFPEGGDDYLTLVLLTFDTGYHNTSGHRHQIRMCEHGVIVARCKCPGNGEEPEVTIVACPPSCQ